MLKLLFFVLVTVLTTFITELIAYKHIRKIDKKERIKLQEWELEYIKNLKESEEVQDKC